MNQMQLQVERYRIDNVHVNLFCVVIIRTFFLCTKCMLVFMLFPTFFENNYFAGGGGGWLLSKNKLIS